MRGHPQVWAPSLGRLAPRPESPSDGPGAQGTAGPLEAEGGDLARAADALYSSLSMEEEYVSVPSFPLEWEDALRDMCDMDFEEEAAKAALRGSLGDRRAAVKALVLNERAAFMSRVA